MVLLLFVIQKIIINLIKFYRYLISPLFWSRCRFKPTCSIYGIQVLNKFGIIKGSLLIVKRILKCNPLYPSGHDPVP